MSNNNLPEAGGVAFATIYSKSGVPIHTLDGEIRYYKDVEHVRPR